MTDHGAVRELLPLFALGALEGSSECDAVCAHLASGCAACAEELASYSRTAGALPIALPAETPRPGVRERLEAKLKTVTQTVPQPHGDNVLAFPKRRDRGTPRWAFAAAAGLAGVGLVFGATTWRELEAEKQARWEAEKIASAQTVELFEVRAERNATKAILAKLSKTDVKVFEIAATDPKSKASGRIVWDKGDRKWTLVAQNLPELASDKVFELWFIKDLGKPTQRIESAGRFRKGVDPVVLHSVTLPAGMDAIDLGAITIEPAAETGPDLGKPTMPPIMAGKTA